MNVNSGGPRAYPAAWHGEAAERHDAERAESRAWAFGLGLTLNVALRLMIVYFAAESALLPDDERFAGKGLTIRNVLIAAGFSMLFPFHYFVRKRWPRYPVWMDSVYLSIFWLDMAGNSFNLFDMYENFDLLPHGWGAGALTVVFMWWQGWSALSAAGVTTMLHAWLECEEYWGDLLFGTRNVRGVWDTVGDLGIGLVCVTVVIIASACFSKRRGARAAPEAVPQEVQPIPFPVEHSARR